MAPVPTTNHAEIESELSKLLEATPTSSFLRTPAASPKTPSKSRNHAKRASHKKGVSVDLGGDRGGDKYPLEDLNERIDEEQRKAKDLRAILSIAQERLVAETKRADVAEQLIKNVDAKVIQLAVARQKAEAEAAKATEQLRWYKMQLETAQREIMRAQHEINALDEERADAEESAVRARATARKMVEEIKTREALEQGRKEGRAAGIREGVAKGREEGFKAGHTSGKKKERERSKEKREKAKPAQPAQPQQAPPSPPVSSSSPSPPPSPALPHLPQTPKELPKSLQSLHKRPPPPPADPPPPSAPEPMFPSPMFEIKPPTPPSGAPMEFGTHFTPEYAKGYTPPEMTPASYAAVASAHSAASSVHRPDTPPDLTKVVTPNLVKVVTPVAVRPTSLLPNSPELIRARSPLRGSSRSPPNGGLRRRHAPGYGYENEEDSGESAGGEMPAEPEDILVIHPQTRTPSPRRPRPTPTGGGGILKGGNAVQRVAGGHTSHNFAAPSDFANVPGAYADAQEKAYREKQAGQTRGRAPHYRGFDETAQARAYQERERNNGAYNSDQYTSDSQSIHPHPHPTYAHSHPPPQRQQTSSSSSHPTHHPTHQPHHPPRPQSSAGDALTERSTPLSQFSLLQPDPNQGTAAKFGAGNYTYNRLIGGGMGPGKKGMLPRGYKNHGGMMMGGHASGLGGGGSGPLWAIEETNSSAGKPSPSASPGGFVIPPVPSSNGGGGSGGGGERVIIPGGPGERTLRSTRKSHQQATVSTDDEEEEEEEEEESDQSEGHHGGGAGGRTPGPGRHAVLPKAAGSNASGGGYQPAIQAGYVPANLPHGFSPEAYQSPVAAGGLPSAATAATSLMGAFAALGTKRKPVPPAPQSTTSNGPPSGYVSANIPGPSASANGTGMNEWGIRQGSPVMHTPGPGREKDLGARVMITTPAGGTAGGGLVGGGGPGANGGGGGGGLMGGIASGLGSLAGGLAGGLAGVAGVGGPKTQPLTGAARASAFGQTQYVDMTGGGVYPPAPPHEGMIVPPGGMITGLGGGTAKKGHQRQDSSSSDVPEIIIQPPSRAGSSASRKPVVSKAHLSPDMAKNQPPLPPASPPRHVLPPIDERPVIPAPVPVAPVIPVVIPDLPSGPTSNTRSRPKKNQKSGRGNQQQPVIIPEPIVIPEPVVVSPPADDSQQQQSWWEAATQSKGTPRQAHPMARTPSPTPPSPRGMAPSPMVNMWETKGKEKQRTPWDHAVPGDPHYRRAPSPVEPKKPTPKGPGANAMPGPFGAPPMMFGVTPPSPIGMTGAFPAVFGGAMAIPFGGANHIPPHRGTPVPPRPRSLSPPTVVPPAPPADHVVVMGGRAGAAAMEAKGSKRRSAPVPAPAPAPVIPDPTGQPPVIFPPGTDPSHIPGLAEAFKSPSHRAFSSFMGAQTPGASAPAPLPQTKTPAQSYVPLGAKQARRMTSSSSSTEPVVHAHVSPSHFEPPPPMISDWPSGASSSKMGRPSSIGTKASFEEKRPVFPSFEEQKPVFPSFEDRQGRSGYERSSRASGSYHHERDETETTESESVVVPGAFAESERVVPGGYDAAPVEPGFVYPDSLPGGIAPPPRSRSVASTRTARTNPGKTPTRNKYPPLVQDDGPFPSASENRKSVSFGNDEAWDMGGAMSSNNEWAGGMGSNDHHNDWTGGMSSRGNHGTHGAWGLQSPVDHSGDEEEPVRPLVVPTPSASRTPRQSGKSIPSASRTPKQSSKFFHDRGRHASVEDMNELNEWWNGAGGPRGSARESTIVVPEAPSHPILPPTIGMRDFNSPNSWDPPSAGQGHTMQEEIGSALGWSGAPAHAGWQEGHEGHEDHGATLMRPKSSHSTTSKKSGRASRASLRGGWNPQHGRMSSPTPHMGGMTALPRVSSPAMDDTPPSPTFGVVPPSPPKPEFMAAKQAAATSRGVPSIPGHIVPQQGPSRPQSIMAHPSGSSRPQSVVLPTLTGPLVRPRTPVGLAASHQPIPMPDASHEPVIPRPLGRPTKSSLKSTKSNRDSHDGYKSIHQPPMPTDHLSAHQPSTLKPLSPQTRPASPFNGPADLPGDNAPVIPSSRTPAPSRGPSRPGSRGGGAGGAGGSRVVLPEPDVSPVTEESPPIQELAPKDPVIPPAPDARQPLEQRLARPNTMANNMAKQPQAQAQARPAPTVANPQVQRTPAPAPKKDAQKEKAWGSWW